MSHTSEPMIYLLHKSGRYYYNRRVPRAFREFDPRKIIRIALKTDSHKEAIKLAIGQNDQTEKYWKQLIDTGQKYSHRQYQEIISQARLLGFSYIQAQQLSQGPLQQMVERLDYLEKQKQTCTQVKAVLGGVAKPVILIDDALQQFWELAKSKILNKSPNQIRKWKNQRIRAIRNFIKCVDNKPINELTRDDTLRFRDWWIRRIEEEDLGTNGANKKFFHLKSIIETDNDNNQLDIDVDRLFKKMTLPEDNEQRRQPFETSYLVSTLLNPENLIGLPEQARAILYAFAETGAGLSEQLGLLPEDIHLQLRHPAYLHCPKKEENAENEIS